MNGRVSSLLSSRRVWLFLGVPVAALVALSAVASISVFPPSVKRKPVAFVTATAQLHMLPPSVLGGTLVRDDPRQFIQQTINLADQMSSPQLRGLIGKAAGIAPRLIALDGPNPTYLAITEREPSGEKRATQIVAEGDLYRVTIDEDLVSPQIGVTAQAPTASQAVRLAAATQAAMSSYLTSLETAAQTPPTRRLEVHALTPIVLPGDSSGGLGNMVALTFFVSLALWVGSVFVITTVVRDLRSLRRARELSA
jgi:hypothetical protein